MTLQDSKITDFVTVSTASYTFDRLAEIYNLARIDYIVPMPMNGKRMAEYVTQYDIDRQESAVALNSDRLETGILMMGFRDQRSWATRLGIIPERRHHHAGQGLMELLIARSLARNLKQVQLEVIRGNEPAIRLFHKLKFEEVRELLVIRRPPGPPAADLAPAGLKVEPLSVYQVSDCLNNRDDNPAWTEESASLFNAGSLKGQSVELSSGESGWIVFQKLPFQLTHFVLSPHPSDELARALLYSVHQQHPLYDTKIENLPTLHPAWPAYQKLGYVVAFSRIEMILPL